ncbi:MAG: GCN5-like N-acetyltransferaser [Ramlibacter sp.]|nr:GCN5-like N-acetyltransferaser [Ramlibacter sp.]
MNLHETLDILVVDRTLRGALWVARDGAAIIIRSIRDTDLPLMQEFVRTLSRNTAYQRLMSPRTPSDEELRRWTEIDSSREHALVAIGSDASLKRILGVARYVMQSGGEAEFAAVLADDWQGRGLGRELLTRLVAAASRRGLQRLTGTTLSTNAPMLALARALGFRFSRVPGSAFVTTLTRDLCV